MIEIERFINWYDIHFTLTYAVKRTFFRIFKNVLFTR